MNSIKILLLLCLSYNLSAQELVQVNITKKVVNRLYMTVFNSIAWKVYDNSTRGNLLLYKDSLMQKSIPAGEIQKLAAYKEPTEIETIKDGKKIISKSEVDIYNSKEWIWQFKKVNGQVLALYMQKPKDVSSFQGERVAFIKASDLKKILSNFEWKFISDNASIESGNKQQLTDNYWEIFKSFRKSLWYFVSTDSIASYQAPDFKTKNQSSDLKTAFQRMNIVTIVQDSNHREYDYQKNISLPFEPDSILGFGYALKLTGDSKQGTFSTQAVAISPLYDPSNTGGEVFFFESMYWMQMQEMMKVLNQDQINFINEIIYLNVAEKLMSDCSY